MKSPIIVSTHRPEFAGVTDAELSAAYIESEAQKRALVERMDDGQDVEAELDALHSRQFALDDELCARGLPLPR